MLEDDVLNLFQLEDTLLATNDSVDGIFFYVVFELDKNRVTSRQFESGCFENGGDFWA